MSVPREQLLIDAFTQLADALANDWEVGDILQLLVDRCTEALRVDAVSILVESSQRRLQLAAATSERMRALEELEVERDEGPCVEAYRKLRPTFAEDMRTQQDRWPQAARKAVDMGWLGVHAFPLRFRRDAIGSLNLYGKVPDEFHAEDVRGAQAFADIATVGILRERRLSDAERRAEQLQHALDSRIVIEQAKGMVAERHGVTTERAFDIIRHYSRSHGRRLREVCAAIVAGDDPLAPGRTPGG